MDGAVSREGKGKDSKGVEQAGEELQSATATKSRTSHETVRQISSYKDEPPRRKDGQEGMTDSKGAKEASTIS